MRQKTVVLSCAPQFNDAQIQGFMQMIRDFEKRDCRVVYYGNVLNSSFDSYASQKISYHKLLYKISFYWVLLRIDSHKWLSRLKPHQSPSNNAVIDYKSIKGIVREAR